MTFSYTAYEILSKNPLMTAINKKSLYDIQAKLFYSIKVLISDLESFKDYETKLKLPQSYPITQQSLFGEDKSSEKVIRELPITNFC